MRLYLIGNTSCPDFFARLEKCVRKKYGEKNDFVYYDQQIGYKDLTKELRLSDVVIAEISQSNTKTGMSIAMALQLRRPVILFYKEDHRPAVLPFLDQVDQENLQLISYDQFSLEKDVLFCLDYAFTTGNLRFNFFITSAIETYLEWISKRYHLPKSVYLRHLIEKDLAANQEYLAAD